MKVTYQNNTSIGSLYLVQFNKSERPTIGDISQRCKLFEQSANLASLLKEILENSDFDGEYDRCLGCGKDMTYKNVLCSNKKCNRFKARKLLKRVSKI